MSEVRRERKEEREDRKEERGKRREERSPAFAKLPPTPKGFGVTRWRGPAKKKRKKGFTG